MTLYTSEVVAQHLDVTERRVRQLRDEGIIREKRPGLYNLVDAMTRYIRYVNAGSKVDLNDERAKLTKVKREAAEMENRARKAELMEVGDVEKPLKTAIHTAFDYQEKHGISQKVVVFTESKRTQKYIASELLKDGFDEDDILLFNGDFNDTMTKEIYRAWQVKNFGKVNYGRSVEYKHAIVDYFKEHSKILVVTDAGSEPLSSGSFMACERAELWSFRGSLFVV